MDAVTSWLQAEHPECPGRVEAVVSRLRQHWGTAGGSSAEVQWLPSARVATPEDLALVHPERYVAAVRAACDRLQVRCAVPHVPRAGPPASRVEYVGPARRRRGSSPVCFHFR